jgi:hypothetical protein
MAAAIAGAAIALVGQHVIKRGEARVRIAELLIEQCAQVVALNDDYRNRVWEERKLGLAGRVESWDLYGHQLATARLKVLCNDVAVLRALVQVNLAGGVLGRCWRKGDSDPAEVETCWQDFKDASEAFVTASAVMVAQQLRKG